MALHHGARNGGLPESHLWSVRDPDSQRDAVAAANCDEIFVDNASGKLASRPELDKALLVASAPVTSSSSPSLTVSAVASSTSSPYPATSRPGGSTSSCSTRASTPPPRPGACSSRSSSRSPSSSTRAHGRSETQVHAAPGQDRAGHVRRARRRRTAGGHTPCSRSPMSSASPAQRSTATCNGTASDQARFARDTLERCPSVPPEHQRSRRHSLRSASTRRRPPTMNSSSKRSPPTPAPSSTRLLPPAPRPRAPSARRSRRAATARR